MSAVAADLMEQVLDRNAQRMSRVVEYTRIESEVARHVLRMLDNPEYVRTIMEETAVSGPARPADEVLAPYLT